VGRERSGTRQYLYLCAVGLIMVGLGACAPFTMRPADQESRAYLQRSQKLMRQGDFEGALQENQRMLSLSPKSPPGDTALFSMGLIHAHHANPKKDFKKARGFFTQMEKTFPESPFAEEARVWVGVLEGTATTAEQESRAHLQGVQQLMRQGDFEGAQRANQKVISLSPKSPPGDAALFGMGLIHIHYANPKKDYKRAQNFFSQLQQEFPRSPLAEEAKIWVGVLEAMEKALLIDIEIEEKKKELTR
jgi:tetratricopeptide (TPR) repeat protein